MKTGSRGPAHLGGGFVGRNEVGVGGVDEVESGAHGDGAHLQVARAARVQLHAQPRVLKRHVKTSVRLLAKGTLERRHDDTRTTPLR